jgi:hypothetical protein
MLTVDEAFYNLTTSKCQFERSRKRFDEHAKSLSTALELTFENLNAHR